MKLYITNFYNLRYFKPNQIPISTAIWDPKWYHNNTSDQNICFLDKNMVMNGIKEEKLSPAAVSEHVTCSETCPYKQSVPNCPFLQYYRAYLDTVDINYLLSEFNRVAEDVRKITKFVEEPEIMLLVHETEDNPCSERWPLQDYFKANGYDLPSWTKANTGIVF